MCFGSEQEEQLGGVQAGHQAWIRVNLEASLSALMISQRWMQLASPAARCASRTTGLHVQTQRRACSHVVAHALALAFSSRVKRLPLDSPNHATECMQRGLQSLVTWPLTADRSTVL